MARLTIEIPENMLGQLAQRAAAAGYSGPGPYLLAMALEDLGVPALARAEIDTMLVEALESGPSEPMTREDWDEIRRAGEAILAASRRKAE